MHNNYGLVPGRLYQHLVCSNGNYLMMDCHMNYHSNHSITECGCSSFSHITLKSKMWNSFDHQRIVPKYISELSNCEVDDWLLFTSCSRRLFNYNIAR